MFELRDVGLSCAALQMSCANAENGAKLHAVTERHKLRENFNRNFLDGLLG